MVNITEEAKNNQSNTINEVKEFLYNQRQQLEAKTSNFLFHFHSNNGSSL